MSEQSSQPDLQDRQLIPARSRVSLSREIGDAVITHNIFGKAKVRIIRKNDKLHRTMWLLAVIGTGIVAAVVWQGWVSSQPIVADVPTVAPVAEVAEVAPASPPEAAPTLAAPAPVNAQPSIVAASAVPVAVAAPKPVLAPRPVMVKPQSAPQDTGGLLAPTQFATSLPAKPAPRPIVTPAPVPKPQTSASSPAIAVPLSSPLAKDSATEVEPANPQGK